MKSSFRVGTLVFATLSSLLLACSSESAVQEKSSSSEQDLEKEELQHADIPAPSKGNLVTSSVIYVNAKDLTDSVTVTLDAAFSSATIFEVVLEHGGVATTLLNILSGGAHETVTTKAFAGTDASGRWTLVVSSPDANRVGALTGWGLQLDSPASASQSRAQTSQSPAQRSGCDGAPSWLDCGNVSVGPSLAGMGYYDCCNDQGWYCCFIPAHR